MNYNWKRSFIGVKAQDAGEEIQRICVKYGKIDKKDVVKESKPKKAVLHSCFEWDDTVAAQAYREYQARLVIRNIVVVSVEDNISEPIRAFVDVVEDNERHFQDIVMVMSDAELREQVVSRAWSELCQWRERYKEYKELGEVFNVIDLKKAA